MQEVLKDNVIMSGTTPVKEWGKQDKQRKRLDCNVVTKEPWGSQGKLCCWDGSSELSPLDLYHTLLHQLSRHQILVVSSLLSHTPPSDQEGWRETHRDASAPKASSSWGKCLGEGTTTSTTKCKMHFSH